MPASPNTPDAVLRAKLYQGGKWKALRRSFLRQEPWCVMCAREGRRTPATVVDHIAGHQDPAWQARFYDPDNLQGLCHAHHNSKGHRAGELRGTLKPEDAPLGFGTRWPRRRRAGGAADKQ
jgi:hypothetical protein